MREKKRRKERERERGGDVRVKLAEPKITRVMKKLTLLIESEGERKSERERSVLQTHQPVTFDWLAGR